MYCLLLFVDVGSRQEYMPRTLRQPCSGPISKRHEKRSLKKLVDFTEPRYWAVLTEQERQDLMQLYPSGKARFWANRPGKKNVNVKRARLNEVERGDRCTFVKKSTIYCIGTVGYVFRNAAFAQQLWGVDDKSEQTWEFVYTVEDMQPANIPSEKVMRVTMIEE